MTAGEGGSLETAQALASKDVYPEYLQVRLGYDAFMSGCWKEHLRLLQAAEDNAIRCLSSNQLVGRVGQPDILLTLGDSRKLLAELEGPNTAQAIRDAISALEAHGNLFAKKTTRAEPLPAMTAAERYADTH